MKTLISIALTVVLVATGYAQKVVVGPNGEAIIDCTEMVAGSFTTDAKVETAATPLTTSTNLNKLVYAKFEVAKADATAASDTEWKDAFTKCDEYSKANGSGWRVPTQRELQMVWVFHEALKKIPGFTQLTQSSGNNWWASTQQGSTQSFFVSFSSGGTNGMAAKSTKSRVRCVREISVP